MKAQNYISMIFHFELFLLLSACAGPATPFGAINNLTKSYTEPAQRPKASIVQNTVQNTVQTPDKPSPIAEPVLDESPLPEIRFFPEKQVLHDQFKLSIIVENLSKTFDLEDLQIRYNNLDVTDSLLAQATVRASPNSVLIEVKNFRLYPELGQDIEVFILNKRSGPVISAKFQEPNCHPFLEDDFGHLNDFKAEPKLLKYIKDKSKNYELNPLMFTGLIAQESGFNPKAISWAKAVGLTQMTPIADRTIYGDSRSWPRNRSISSYPYPIVKSMILSGHLNQKKDWRLNPYYSIRGGLMYMNWVRGYWSSKQNRKLFEEVFGNDDVLLGQVMLASYNSGPARVKASIQELGVEWLSSSTLNAARKYVATVTSYCESFRN